MITFSKDEILAQLEKILSDKNFSRSKINGRLLAYLVQCTLDSTEIKETTIGIKFFGEKYDPIKSDNKVRVYIYHLRKKLEEYYENADHNEIVFYIDKGQYKVRFDQYHKIKTKNSNLKRNILIALATAITATICIVCCSKPTNHFWNSLINNNLNTSVVFGDYFTIEAPLPTGGKGIIRDYKINSEEEFQNYLEKNPKQNNSLEVSSQHYFNWVAPYCSKEITKFLVKYDYPFEIIQISEWSVSQLENENIVYFGQTKSMGVLKDILIENFPQYSYRNEGIIRKDPITKKTTIYQDVVSYEDKIVDYTIVSKITSPTGNELRFFLSDQDCGAISALQFFTNNDSVNAFYLRHNIELENDFFALFKVTGWHRKTYNMELILLDKKND